MIFTELFNFSFGQNKKPVARVPTLIESIKQTANDKIWWVVAGSALLSGLCGAIANGWGGLIEGLAIIIATLVMIITTSTADFFKDRSFVNL